MPLFAWEESASLAFQSRAVETRLEAIKTTAHPRLDSAQGLAEMGRKLGVRQTLVEGERDRLLLSCFQSLDAAFDRERVRTRQQHLHRTGSVVGEHHSWFLIVDGHRVDLPSAHLIETADRKST